MLMSLLDLWCGGGVEGKRMAARVPLRAILASALCADRG